MIIISSLSFRHSGFISSISCLVSSLRFCPSLISSVTAFSSSTNLSLLPGGFLILFSPFCRAGRRRRPCK
ncbi:hypothetical protein Peur_064897 [Populus x canadensis]